MKMQHINDTGWSYSQAVKISDYKELVFISGQVPANEKEEVPESFIEQCRLAWSNIEKQLKNAGMSLRDLVKVTVYLSDRKYTKDNAQIRQEILEDSSPALTIMVTGIYDEKWLLEIEAIAGR